MIQNHPAIMKKEMTHWVAYLDVGLYDVYLSVFCSLSSVEAALTGDRDKHDLEGKTD